MSVPAVSLRRLVKRYPLPKSWRDIILHPVRRQTIEALRSVDWEIPAGRCACLLGPNGAGKTTLLKILATLILPDEGSASVFGHDVAADPERAKTGVGLAVADERSFYWRLTVEQNMAFFAALYNVPRRERSRRVGELLRLTGLESAAGLRFNALSTGMRQMLAFARALLADASLLLVDEPTRSLDPRAAERIRRFISEEIVARRGRSVVWATHNLEEARAHGQELAVLDRGAIKFSGPAEELTECGRLTMAEAYARLVPPPEARDDAHG